MRSSPTSAIIVVSLLHLSQIIAAPVDTGEHGLVRRSQASVFPPIRNVSDNLFKRTLGGIDNGKGPSETEMIAKINPKIIESPQELPKEIILNLKFEAKNPNDPAGLKLQSQLKQEVLSQKQKTILQAAEAICMKSLNICEIFVRGVDSLLEHWQMEYLKEAQQASKAIMTRIKDLDGNSENENNAVREKAQEAVSQFQEWELQLEQKISAMSGDSNEFFAKQGRVTLEVLTGREKEIRDILHKYEWKIDTTPSLKMPEDDSSIGGVQRLKWNTFPLEILNSVPYWKKDLALRTALSILSSVAGFNREGAFEALVTARFLALKTARPWGLLIHPPTSCETTSIDEDPCGSYLKIMESYLDGEVNLTEILDKVKTTIQTVINSLSESIVLKKGKQLSQSRAWSRLSAAQTIFLDNIEAFRISWYRKRDKAISDFNLHEVQAMISKWSQLSESLEYAAETYATKLIAYPKQDLSQEDKQKIIPGLLLLSGKYLSGNTFSNMIKAYAQVFGKYHSYQVERPEARDTSASTTTSTTKTTTIAITDKLSDDKDNGGKGSSSNGNKSGKSGD